MKILQETTEWRVPTPNHVYFVNDSRDRMFGYVPQSTQIPVRFSKPLQFATRGRRFQAVPNQWEFEAPAAAASNAAWTVTGSRGDQYQVEQTVTGMSCTCPGFRFREQCRHVAEITAQLSKSC